MSMQIALVGASGNIGCRILDEALSRGCAVKGVVRKPELLGERAGLKVTKADVNDIDAATYAVEGVHTLVVSIPWLNNAGNILRLARQACVKRLIAVVGAGSLEARPGVRVIDAPEFPPAWRPGAYQAARALEILRNEAELDWVAVSPSWTVVSGDRTGEYRIGGDQLLRDERGHSRISRDDLAVAIVDEVTEPKHHRQRIIVGY